MAMDHQKLQESDAEETQEGGEGRFAALIPLLEASVDEIEASCDELDHDALMDPESEMDAQDEQMLKEGYDALPDELKKECAKVLENISKEDAEKLASHLADEDMIEDEERTAGWLQRVGKIVAGGEDEDEEAEDEGDDEDDQSDDEEPSDDESGGEDY